MTWFCRTCEVNNSQALLYCRQCNQHWEKVWTAPRRRRSASKNKDKGKDPSKQKETVEEKPPKRKGKERTGQEPASSLAIFAEALPWVNTTPQSRLPRHSQEDTKGGETGTALPLIPPSPVLAPPPKPAASTTTEAPLDAEEEKLLQTLRTLHSMGVPMSTEQTAMAELLEKRVRATTPATISHSQVNKLNRLKSQLSSLSQRIQVLDQEWLRFITHVLTSAKEHAAMYQACRKDHCANYEEKAQELMALKQTLSQMSQRLSADLAVEAPKTEEFDVEAAMENLAALAQAPTMPELIDDDMESEVGASPTSDTEPKTETGTKPSKPRVAFRGATSPNRVANVHLKPEIKKDKTVGVTSKQADK